MLDPTSSLLTVSPPDSNFIPRREFIHEPSRGPSSFALLAVAGTGLVRLSSFPEHVVAALRRTFEQRGILRAVREEPRLKLCEFSLEDKPWSNGKNSQSEKLFVDILTAIFQHGYTFLSTIDYGREHDDRVSIAFSKPAVVQSLRGVSPSAQPTLAPYGVPFALSFPSATVLRVISPPLHSTPAILQGVRAAWPRGVVSEKKVADGCYEFKLKGYRWFQEDTFATDSLRHILALLNSLDSHAFTLLTSLSLSGGRSRVKDLWVFVGPPQDDSPGSSLSNGSNVEIARTMSPLGPGSPDTLLSPTLPTASGESLKHTRFATSPGGTAPIHQISLGHGRAQTEPNGARPSGLAQSQSSVLRKKVPTKSSLQCHSEEEQQQPESYQRTNSNAVTDSVGSVDMTGIGTAAQTGRVTPGSSGNGEIHKAADTVGTDAASTRKSRSRSPPPQQDVQRQRTPDIIYTTPSQHEREQAMSVSPAGELHLESLKTPPTLPEMPSPKFSEHSKAASTPDSQRKMADVPQSVYGQAQIEGDMGIGNGPEQTPPLLSPAAFRDTGFRDSAFSSSTGQSYEIPISWTGLSQVGPADMFKGKRRETQQLHGSPFVVPVKPLSQTNPKSPNNVSIARDSALSTSFELPGAWQATPAEEKPRAFSPAPTPNAELHNLDTSADLEHSLERKEVSARVASPTLSDADPAERKSEIGLLGIMSGRDARSQPPSPTKREVGGEGRSTAPVSGSGWVLVNVEGASSTADGPGDRSPTTSHPPVRQAVSDPMASGTDGGSKGGNFTAPKDSGARSLTPPQEQASSMSPIAKVIVAADAVASPPSSPKATQRTPSPPRSTLKRFFSRNKSKKSRVKSEGRVSKVRSIEIEDREDKAFKRSKWHSRGAVEASRTHKRVSFD